MFKANDLVVRILPNKARFVRRIVEVRGDKYLVSNPMFACWGSTFARWSTPKEVTKRYTEKMFTLITDKKVIKSYNTIKKGQSTDLLPRIRI